ncbi:hypothetical protein [Lysinibacillus xylanilyticus]|uniref:hypothetical protein n=1 Tax=Lysinibacillus xylanilyticus TaxID=582475 RepID=UPI0036DA70A4
MLSGEGKVVRHKDYAAEISANKVFIMRNDQILFHTPDYCLEELFYCIFRNKAFRRNFTDKNYFQRWKELIPKQIPKDPDLLCMAGSIKVYKGKQPGYVKVENHTGKVFELEIIFLHKIVEVTLGEEFKHPESAEIVKEFPDEYQIDFNAEAEKLENLGAMYNPVHTEVGDAMVASSSIFTNKTVEIKEVEPTEFEKKQARLRKQFWEFQKDELTLRSEAVTKDLRDRIPGGVIHEVRLISDTGQEKLRISSGGHIRKCEYYRFYVFPDLDLVLDPILNSAPMSLAKHRSLLDSWNEGAGLLTRKIR